MGILDAMMANTYASTMTTHTTTLPFINGTTLNNIAAYSHRMFTPSTTMMPYDSVNIVYVYDECNYDEEVT